MKKYIHEFTVAFSVRSNADCSTDADEDYPSREETLAGLEQRLKYLKKHPEEVAEAVGCPIYTERLVSEEALEWWGSLDNSAKAAYSDWYNTSIDAEDIELLHTYRDQLPLAVCANCGSEFVQSHSLENWNLFQGVRAEEHNVFEVVPPHINGECPEPVSLCSSCYTTLRGKFPCCAKNPK